MIIQFNQDFTLLDVGDNFETKRLFDEFHVANYVISNQDTEPELQLFYTNPQNPYYPDRPWNGISLARPTQRAFRDDLRHKFFCIPDDPEKILGHMVDNVFPFIGRVEKYS